MTGIGDQQIWGAQRTLREKAFGELRRTDTLVRTTDASFFATDDPTEYWSLVRYKDVWAASRNPSVFSSASGTNITDDPPEVAELFGSMINMDDPRHFRMRSIVSRAFAPSHLVAVHRAVRERTDAVMTRAIQRFGTDEFDFVDEIASLVPLGVICQIMGIPSEDEPAILGWTNTILGAGDPGYGTSVEALTNDALTNDALTNDALAMFDYAKAHAGRARARPGDDLTSVIMAGEVDGERLTPSEFGAFFILLVAAGNETTRNALAHGLLALTEHPDQRDAWFGDFDGVAKTAVEEIVRWATPVIHFRRTALTDITLRGTTISAGDKVVLWYCSANRDETVWSDPDVFDVRRPVAPPHVGFGGGGPHFCLGANLARHEMTVVFDAIRQRMPSLEVTADPVWLESNFINGVKRLPCSTAP